MSQKGRNETWERKDKIFKCKWSQIFRDNLCFLKVPDGSQLSNHQVFWNTFLLVGNNLNKENKEIKKIRLSSLTFLNEDADEYPKK